MSLISELRRRNVLRMAVLYVVAAWLIMQVAGVLIDLSALPEWSGPWVLAALAIGFPIALILSWFYEITPEGPALDKDIAPGDVVAHAGRRMDFVIIAVLAAAVVLFAYDKWWTGSPQAAPEKSIAVLPFVNMSADPDQEYFSDGISEEILNLLAQLPDLTVISRSSAFSFKGKDVSIPEIAEQLNVANVLEGSVRKAGNNVRITAQLIEADSDAHLWSQTYDRELDDIFAVQDEIAAAISSALQLELSLVSGAAVPLTAIATANSTAYDAYLKGRELMHHRNRDALEEAVKLLERAVSLDDTFAPAHAQLAIATMLLTVHVSSDREMARRTALRHLDRAEALEPDLADVHAGRALLAQFADEPNATIEHAQKALAVNPNYVDAMNRMRGALYRLGRDEEAHAVLEQMLVIDPLSIIGRAAYASWLLQRGRTEEAHELADQIIAQSPSTGYRVHARTYLWGEGELAKALNWSLRVPRDGYSHAWNIFSVVGEYDEARRVAAGRIAHWIDAHQGRWDEAIQASLREVELSPDSGPLLADAAELMYLAGHFDEALALHERALAAAPEGLRAAGFGPYFMIQQAVALRRAGSEDRAQAAAQIAKQENAARRAAGEQSFFIDAAEAMIAAFDHDREGAISALRLAVQNGLRWQQVLDDPVFEDLQTEPSFIELRQEMQAIVSVEHDKILQLICFDNPVPEDWQPMPKTCEGVAEARAH